MTDGSANHVPNGARPPATTGLSSDVKWMTGVIVAAIIAIGVAAGLVSVTVLQLNRIATDMQNQEHRTASSNVEVIQEFQRLVESMRDEYRDGLYGVTEVLHELHAIRQRLNVGTESNAARERDLERTLSKVDDALAVLMLFRPVRTTGVTQQILNELKAIREHLEGMDESEDESTDESEDESTDESEDEDTDESENDGTDDSENDGTEGSEDDERR